MVTFIKFAYAWTYTQKHSLQLNRTRREIIAIRGFLQNASLFCPLARNGTFQPRVARSQGKGALLGGDCRGFFLWVGWGPPPQSVILKQSRFLIADRHCNWRQPNPFSWDTVPVKPRHRFQNNLFGKVWRNILLVKTNIYLNCIPLMTLTSHFNKQSKHFIYTYQLRRVSLLKFLQRKLCYQAGRKN